MSHLVFVVDGKDRIVRVLHADDGKMPRFLGHTVWTYLPGAEPVLEPLFEEARDTGETLEVPVFYAGGTVDASIAPAGRALTVRLTRRTELNVRTLATLARSLRTIEEELSAREPVQRDRPAPASPQALP